jgi:hypothetical protein
LQGKLRVVGAKVLLRKLRTEAKDLGKLQENNETLKREIEELKAKAAGERVKMEKEFVRKAQETLLASNKTELEQLKSKVIELEESLKSEKQLREDAENRIQSSSAHDSSNMLCWKCRERRVDEESIAPASPQQEVIPNRRNSRRSSAGDLRSSLPPVLREPHDITSPNRGHLGVSPPTPAKMSHIEDYKQANEQLQSEVSRLRGTNIEHLATIENLKRELHRMKEDEDRLRSELTKKRPLDHAAARQRRGSARFMKETVDKVVTTASTSDAKFEAAEQTATSAPAASWISTWDAEDDDTSESGSVQDTQSLTASVGGSNNNIANQAISSVESAALQSVEKNLEKWKAELIKVSLLCDSKICFSKFIYIYQS